MRFQLLLAGLLSLVILSDAVAQTAAPSSPELTAHEFRKQDRQVSTAQSIQQNIARRDRAEFVRKCMADRQAERRIAARALRDTRPWDVHSAEHTEKRINAKQSRICSQVHGRAAGRKKSGSFPMIAYEYSRS